MKTAVLHFALQPVTGPWSVVRALAAKQREVGLYSEVGIAVLHYSDWPDEYIGHLREFPGPSYSKAIVRSFGTASFLSRMFVSNPLEQWIREFQSSSGADIIVLHMHNAWLSGVFLPINIETGSVVPIATFHGVAGAPDLSRQPVRRYLHRAMAQRLVRFDAALTSVDAANLVEAERLFGLSASDFHIVPNGVPKFSHLRKRQGALERPLCLAHIGTINEGKGWEILVQAALAASAAGRKLKVILAGAGPGAALASSYSNRYPDLIEYRGYVSDPVTKILPEVDALVLMSKNDGLPMSIIEAMSSGAAIVATRVGAIPDVLNGGEAGMLVERSIGALTDAIVELCDSPSRLSQLQSEALRRFEEKYEIGCVVRAYDTIYRDRGFGRT